MFGLSFSMRMLVFVKIRMGTTQKQRELFCGQLELNQTTSINNEILLFPKTTGKRGNETMTKSNNNMIDESLFMNDDFFFKYVFSKYV
jgi:hypothetical protein